MHLLMSKARRRTSTYQGWIKGADRERARRAIYKAQLFVQMQKM